MKRILVDATNVASKITGAGVYATNVLKKLKSVDKENKYTVLVSDKIASNHLFDDFEVITTAAPTIGLKRDVCLSWLLSKKTIKNNFDIFYSFMPYLPTICPITSAITIHDLGFLRYKNFLRSDLHFLYFRDLINRSIKKSEKIFTVSETSKKEIEFFFKVDPKKIIVTYEGSSFEDFSQDGVEQSANNLQGRPFLLFVGERREHKNLPNLIEAFALYKAKYKNNTCLVLAGSAYRNNDQKIKQAIAECKLDNDVVLLERPSQESLYCLYKNCLALVLVSFYEGFGIPLLEAMNIGKPILASGVSAMPEITAGAALLVDPHNISKIASGIEMILSNQSLSQDLSAKGLERSKFFSWTKTADLVSEALSSL